MNKIKTSELITKFALASEEACKCEDENFFRVTELEKLHNPITPKDLVKVIRATLTFLVSLLFVQFARYYRI